MSYFRGLDAAPNDPWAEPGPIAQVTSGIASAVNAVGTGIASLLGAAATPPATVPHPAPLTAAEQAKILGTSAGATATLPAGGGRSKLPLLLGVAAVGVVGFVLWRRRPRSNPSSATRRRRRALAMRRAAYRKRSR